MYLFMKNTLALTTFEHFR